MADYPIETRIKMIEELKAYTYRGESEEKFFKKYEGVPIEKLMEELNIFRKFYRDKKNAHPPGGIFKK